MQNTKNYNVIPEKVKNVLIVRQHHQLGDMLCALPMFAAIRKKFPYAHITLIASPVSYEILNNPANPYLNEVINFNKQTFLHILKFFKNLFSRKYDVGIVPSTASISRTSHYINYIAGAKTRVGVESVENKINKSAYLLNVKRKFFWKGNKLHQTERNLDISRLIDCDITPEEKKTVRIFLDQSEKEYANKYYAENFPDKSKPVIAFHPGAAKIQNRWGKDKFVKLMTLLYRNYNPYLCLTSGPIDKEITDSIKSELSKLNIPCNLIEKTSIRKVGALVEKASLYITNDTGTMHVASYVNANVVGLFGPTNGYEWGPVNERGSYIQSVSDNIDDITVDQVFELANAKLETNNKQ
jgi:ADP-heptose:LPS heptosyltransferase